MTEMREDLAAALAEIKGDWDEPTSAWQAGPDEPTVIDGEVIDPTTGDVVVVQDGELIADDPDDDGATPGPGEKYTSAKAARRELQRLSRNAAKTMIEMAVWLSKDGHRLCGFKSEAEAIQAIMDVAQSHAYRIRTLYRVGRDLANASGQAGPDGLRHVLEMPGLNSKSADVLGKRIKEIVAAVEEESHDHTQEQMADEILPRIINRYLAPQTPLPLPQDEDENHQPWPSDDQLPGDPYAEDERDDAAGGTGESYGSGHEDQQPPRDHDGNITDAGENSSGPTEPGEIRPEPDNGVYNRGRTIPCPHCGGPVPLDR